MRTLNGTTPRFSTSEPEMLMRLQARLGIGFRYSQSGKYDWRIAFDRKGAEAAGVVQLDRSEPRTNPLTAILTSLGLFGLHSEDKFIPAQYLSANRVARLALLQGLLDTDGWVEKWGSVRFATSSWRLAQDVVELARSPLCV